MLPLKTLSFGKVTKMVLTPPKMVTTSYYVITTTPLSPHHSWFWIWKLKLPAKIIFFFWLAYHHLVPTLSLLNHQKMNTSSLCTRCGLKVETFLHCVRDYIFSRNLWHHIGFSDPTFLSLMDAHDWLKVGSTDPQANFLSAGVWWAWIHRNLMCLNNESWSLNRLSFKIQSMIEIFTLSFSSNLVGTSVNGLIK
jgi:hypothetical protein